MKRKLTKAFVREGNKKFEYTEQRGSQFINGYLIVQSPDSKKSYLICENIIREPGYIGIKNIDEIREKGSEIIREYNSIIVSRKIVESEKFSYQISPFVMDSEGTHYPFLKFFILEAVYGEEDEFIDILNPLFAYLVDSEGMIHAEYTKDMELVPTDEEDSIFYEKEDELIDAFFCSSERLVFRRNLRELCADYSKSYQYIIKEGSRGQLTCICPKCSKMFKIDQTILNMPQVCTCRHVLVSKAADVPVKGIFSLMIDKSTQPNEYNWQDITEGSYQEILPLYRNLFDHKKAFIMRKSEDGHFYDC